MSAIAVVGDEPELAEQILGVLLERGFAAEDIRVLADRDHVGSVATARDAEFRIGLGGADTLAGADAVLFFGSAALARELSAAVPSGAVVLDASPHARGQPGTPLVVPEVNPDVARARVPGMVLGSPMPAAVGLAIAIAPLHEAARVRRVVTTILFPASARGAAGIERLSRQSVSLLQGQSLEPEQDPELLAYNVRPHASTADSTWAPDEQEIAREIATLFGEPRIEVLATALRVPVFYGIGQSVYVETEESLDADEAERVLRGARSIFLASELDEVHELEAEEADADDAPEPTDRCPGLVEVSGSDAVHVARVRADPRRPGALAFWMCFDDQRKGVALNLVSTLEIALGERR